MNFAAISAIIAIVRSLVSLINEARSIARQNQTLTPQEEAVLDSQLKNLLGDNKPAHWRIDP